MTEALHRITVMAGELLGALACGDLHFLIAFAGHEFEKSGRSDL